MTRQGGRAYRYDTMNTIQDSLNKFRNKKIRIISKNDFTYITLDFNYFGENGICFTDKVGHDVMLSVSDIKKIEVLS